MNAEPNLQILMHRTRRYWYQDGFSDLGMAAYMLALALFFAAEALTPLGSPLWLIWGVGGPLLLIGGGLLVNQLVRQLKEGYTYPRTGYVSYERSGRSRMVQLIGAGLLSAAIAVAIVGLNRGLQVLTPLFGLAFMAAFAYLGYRLQLIRYWLLAALSLLAGLALSPLALGNDQASALFFAVVGLGLLISGGLTWRRYSRSAQPVEGE